MESWVGVTLPLRYILDGEVFNLSIDLTVPGSNPGQLRRTERRNYGSFLPITSNDFAAAAVDTTLEKQEYWRNIKRTKNKNVF